MHRSSHPRNCTTRAGCFASSWIDSPGTRSPSTLCLLQKRRNGFRRRALRLGALERQGVMYAMICTEVAQWVEAIGTIAAVFVAILTTLYFEVWKQRRERPKLEIYYDNDDPQCRRLSPSPDNMSSYFIRLKIINNGNAPAQGCIGRLVAIADDRGMLRRDWWDISGLTWSTQSTVAPH